MASFSDKAFNIISNIPLVGAGVKGASYVVTRGIGEVLNDDELRVRSKR